VTALRPHARLSVAKGNAERTVGAYSNSNPGEYGALAEVRQER
jgi:hypothetical protein